MFDLAWSEFGLIGLVAVLMLGPKELPQAMRALGRLTRQGRKMLNDVQGHVRDLVNEAELAELRKSVEKAPTDNLEEQIKKQSDASGEIGQVGVATKNENRDVEVVGEPPSPTPSAAPSEGHHLKVQS